MSINQIINDWDSMLSNSFVRALAAELFELKSSSLWEELLVEHPYLLGAFLEIDPSSKDIHFSSQLPLNVRLLFCSRLLKMKSLNDVYGFADVLQDFDLKSTLLHLSEMIKWDELDEQGMSVVCDMLKDVLLETIPIPAGVFMMGSSEDDSDAWDNKKPRHKVTLSKNLRMMKYPVSQYIWRSFFDEPLDCAFEGVSLPVDNISWFDSVSFANQLSERMNLEPVYKITKTVEINWEANGWRLPTEAEWEYAARANRSYRFSGSDSLDEVGWYGANSAGTTHAVGQKKPNGWLLSDMSGMVSEWCWDWYGHYPQAHQKDPKGPSFGTDRVRRGGSWSSNVWHAQVDFRYYGVPTRSRARFGARFVRLDHFED